MKSPLDLRNLFIRTNQANVTGSAGLVAGGSSSCPVVRTDKLADGGQYQSL